MALSEIEGLRVYPEQAQAFRPGSRRVDFIKTGLLKFSDQTIERDEDI
jgi:hypothetical protein